MQAYPVLLPLHWGSIAPGFCFSFVMEIAGYADDHRPKGVVFGEWV